MAQCPKCKEQAELKEILENNGKCKSCYNLGIIAKYVFKIN
jgi:Zn ribbon nucleic-acid-binding protein